MMTKSIFRRVGDSFEDNNHEDIYKYLDWLRSSISDLAQSVRRSAALIILLIAAFELIITSPTVALSLGPFRVSRGSVVLEFIPPLVAYLWLQLVMDSSRLNISRYGFEVAFKEWSAKASANDLDRLVQPALPLYWNIDPFAPRAYNILDRADQVLEILFATITFTAIITFEVQAYYLLYRPLDHHQIVLAATIILTVIICISTLIYFVLSPRRWRR